MNRPSVRYRRWRRLANRNCNWQGDSTLARDILRDQRVVVLGGSSGIGYAVAQRVLDEVYRENALRLVPALGEVAP